MMNEKDNAKKLATPGEHWAVRAGCVHLFLARVGAEGETLARHPLCSVETDEVVFSLHDAAPPGWMVVAQSTAETQLEQLTRKDVSPEQAAVWMAKLRAAAGLEESAEEFAWERMARGAAGDPGGGDRAAAAA